MPSEGSSAFNRVNGDSQAADVRAIGESNARDETPSPTVRVLFIDHTARMGGGEIALLNLVCVLRPERCTPVVMLFSDGPLRQKLLAAGVETFVVPLASDIAETRKEAVGGGAICTLWKIVKTAAFVLRVRAAIVKARPSVVHTNSLKADIIGGLAARLAGVPLVWHVRDRISDDYLPARVARVFRWLAKWLPQQVIANSRSTLSTLGRTDREPARLFGFVRPSATRVVYDGTHLADAPSPKPIPAGELVVGLVGRLAPWKGQHVFIDAARSVHAQFPLARFRIIGSAMFGEDDYADRLRNTVSAYGLGDVIEFTGFREDVAAAIGELDVLVHASITGEPFGQVIIEGMSAAKPVVATNGGGVPEIVDDGVTGFLVPMNDAAALARQIERLLADEHLRTTMGKAGRRRVEHHFTIRHTADNVQRLFDEMTQSRVV